jgi:Cu/Ag efflux protein CusF
MRRVFLISWLAVVGLTVCGGVWAARRADCPTAASKAAIAQELASLRPAEELPLSAGRIVAVNEKNGTLTVRVGASPRYALDHTTRVFAVEDKALLAGHTPGDKIRLDLVRKNGRYVISRLENSN